MVATSDSLGYEGRQFVSCNLNLKKKKCLKDFSGNIC